MRKLILKEQLLRYIDLFRQKLSNLKLFMVWRLQ